MHFNYRPDAVALTLPRRRPAIVKFLNYRYLDARVERPVNSKDIRQLPLFLSLSLSLSLLFPSFDGRGASASNVMIV